MRNRTVCVLLGLCTLQVAFGQELELDLDRALALGESQSRSLTLAQYKAALQKSGLDLSLRGVLPQLSVGYSHNDTVTANSADTFDKRLFLTVKQPLFDGGRGQTQRTLAEIGLELTQQENSQLRQELLGTIWMTYQKLTLSQEKAKVRSSNLDQARQQLVIATTQFKLGEIREIDLLDVQIQVKNLENQLDQARLEDELLLSQFQQLLRLPETAVPKLTTPLDGQYSGLELTLDRQSFQAVAQAKNLEFRKLDFQKRQLQVNTSAAQWEWVPNVSGEMTLAASGPVFPLQQPSANFSLNFSFPAPLAPLSLNLTGGLTGNSSRTRGLQTSSQILPDPAPLLSSAQLALQAQQLTEEELKWTDGMRNTIRQFLTGYALKKKSLANLREALSLEQKRVAVTEKRFGFGEIKPSELVEARTKKTDAELKVWDAILDLKMTERSFEQNLGLEPGQLKLVAAGGQLQ